MRSRASLAGTALACALLATLLVPAQAQDDAPPLAHRPGIAPGDFWDFRVTGNAEGTVHNRVAATETRADRDGHKHEAFRVHAVSDVVTTQGRGGIETQVEEHLEVDKWVRTHDEATIGIAGTVTIRQNGQDTRTTNVEREYMEPLVESVYPFGVGSAWKVKVTVYTTQGSEERAPERSVFTVLVEEYERVTVPAGSFMAYRMNVSFTYEGGYTLRWYSDEACTTVKEERYGRTRSDPGPEAVYVLTDHRCSHVAAEDPTYDPEQVTLLARPPAGPTGTGSVDFEDTPAPSNEGVGAGVWVALAVVVGVSLTLIGYGRKRR